MSTFSYHTPKTGVIRSAQPTSASARPPIFSLRPSRCPRRSWSPAIFKHIHTYWKKEIRGFAKSWSNAATCPQCWQALDGSTVWFQKIATDFNIFHILEIYKKCREIENKYTCNILSTQMNWRVAYVGQYKIPSSLKFMRSTGRVLKQFLAGPLQQHITVVLWRWSLRSMNHINSLKCKYLYMRLRLIICTCLRGSSRKMLWSETICRQNLVEVELSALYAL